MKNKLFITPALLIIFLLAACGSKTTAQPTEAAIPSDVAATPDPCSKANLPDEVTKVNDLMREFDDYSKLASSTPQAQLVQIIPPMQEIRRRAESQKVPECLKSLKVLQVNHMNTVIETLMAFMSNPKSENINKGITSARDFHLQYDTEIARLLGLTLVPGSAGNDVAPATSQPSGLSILNPGPDAVTLFSAPDLKSGGVATLEAGLTAVAFGQSADGLWIQVEVPGQPGQKAWASAELVQVSGELPVVNP